MKRYIVSLVALLLSGYVLAQTSMVTGRLYDDAVQPLVSGTVVLLNPVDSTLEYFGITDRTGSFMIKNIKEGEYLLQASYIGFQSLFSLVKIPRPTGSSLGDIVLMPFPEDLEEVQVVAERVPLRIKGDTIEFDASAFKTHADAVTEDLIKKLPGIEVDRAGNIKALGENVTKVFVDGKEFFGSDPTVATRNLPADAIDKIQVYDKKSDATEFTGIDDGTRDKAINLKLKEDKKKGVFGDVMAAYGTDSRYKGSAKAYRFSDKVQIAGLGMMNNVNQYGFSFGDYMDFNGGLGGMMRGGSSEIKIESSDNLPINFGQPVEGLTTSGAGGLNFSYATNKDNRVFASYLANGSKKDLSKVSNTDYYSESGTYSSYDSTESETMGLAHRVNFGFRKRIDSLQNLIVNGDVGMSGNSGEGVRYLNNMVSDDLMSTLSSSDKDMSESLSASASASYIYKSRDDKSVFKLNGYGGLRKNFEASEIYNSIDYFVPLASSVENQFRDRSTDLLYYSGKSSYTVNLGKGIYLTPQLEFGDTREQLLQEQGHAGNGRMAIDSLSPEFEKRYVQYVPGLSFQWNTEKTQLMLGLKSEFGTMETAMDGRGLPEMTVAQLRPLMSWDYSPRSGRKMSLNYSSSVVMPEVSQLLPTVNDLNPLMVYSGNMDLAPEYSQRVNGHWFLFDQFSFTSVMMGFNGTYTQNKINWATTITDSLVQIRSLTNVGYDYAAGVDFDFSTPIRKLGIDISLRADEGWNRGLSLVNGVENEYNTVSQKYSLKVNNRKKKKLDLTSGVSATLTRTRYDLQSGLDKDYFDMTWFMDVDYSPSERWNVQASADVQNYADRNFGEAVLVPLLRADVSYYFMKNRRASLTLSGFDLLNKNQLVQRVSELNYLRDTRSNTISRYFLLSFKYRLNRAEKKGGLQIDVSGR